MMNTFLRFLGGRKVIEMQDNENQVNSVSERLQSGSTSGNVVAPAPAPKPQFGSCRGMLVIVSDDDEHLEHFKDYMQRRSMGLVQPIDFTWVKSGNWHEPLLPIGGSSTPRSHGRIADAAAALATLRERRRIRTMILKRKVQAREENDLRTVEILLDLLIDISSIEMARYTAAEWGKEVDAAKPEERDPGQEMR